MGRGRPGGNPAFGKEIKIEPIYEEPLAKKQLQIRLPESQQEKLDRMPSDERNRLVRGAIAAALLGGEAGAVRKTALLEGVVRDAIALKSAAISREKKLKHPDRALIEKWEREIDELEGLLT